MTPLHRRDDWRARLAAEMDRQRRHEFTWGAHDCVIGFGAAIVQAITGTDLARGHRGTYTTPEEALAIIRASGANTLGDFLALYLPEIHPAFAQVGDLATLPHDGPIREAVGMFDASFLVVLTENGHGHRPRQDAVRAFRVGE